MAHVRGATRGGKKRRTYLTKEKQARSPQEDMAPYVGKVVEPEQGEAVLWKKDKRSRKKPHRVNISCKGKARGKRRAIAQKGKGKKFQVEAF